jgi:outer membrane protein assembly factor BamB
LSPTDADVIWRFDMMREANCWPHNALNSAAVVRGDRLYVATGSTLSHAEDGETTSFIRSWEDRYRKDAYPSPALIVLDKNTGKLLAKEVEGMFERTFHGAHSSPALGMVNGKPLLVYGGGDGTCYAFDPDFTPTADGSPAQLKLVWKFNCTDPASYGSGFRADRPEKSEIIGTPVIYQNRVFVALGNDLTNSGSRAFPGRLLCIDAGLTGDVTRSAKHWSFDEMRSSASTVAIADGLLYTADAAGNIYCLDADTGKVHWTHATTSVWSSPLVADGKVYVATHNGGLLVFAQGSEKKLLSHSMGAKDLVATPAAANGVLYIASQRHLYALKQGSHGSLVPHED